MLEVCSVSIITIKVISLHLSKEKKRKRGGKRKEFLLKKDYIIIQYIASEQRRVKGKHFCIYISCSKFEAATVVLPRYDKFCIFNC